jgi:hypothetical protein
MNFSFIVYFLLHKFDVNMFLVWYTFFIILYYIYMLRYQNTIEDIIEDIHYLKKE